MITRSVVTVPSYTGADTQHQLFTQEGATCLAVFFPGVSYPYSAPLLWYARQAALLAGCDALSLEYGYQAARRDYQRPDFPHLAQEVLAAITRTRKPSHQRLLFVSKSLGTLVAGEVALALGDVDIQHLFLMPLVTTAPHLWRSRGVAISGTADPQFDAAARALVRESAGMDLIEVPDLGHSLESETDIAVSLQVLGLVSETCARLAPGL